MKKILFGFSLLASTLSLASDYKPMLGIMIGHPTGLSLRQSMSENNSWDAGLAYSLLGGGFELHGDYLWDKVKMLKADKQPVEFYHGIGLRIESWSSRRSRGLALGPRFPFGLATNFENPRLQIFGEVAPIVDLVPSLDIDIHLAIGVRYRF